MASFWTALDFDKLTGIEELTTDRCPPLPLDGLQKMSSAIKSLEISDGNMASGSELTRVLCSIPKLSELIISTSMKITRLGVVEQLKDVTSSYRGEEEIAPEGLLLLPPQLQKLHLKCCPELSLLPHGGNGGGLQGLCSLHLLEIRYCPKFITHYLASPSSSCFPFPTSLQILWLVNVGTLAPLSNLASLTELHIYDCGDFEGIGLRRLLAHGCLRELSVHRTSSFFAVECCEDTPEMLEPSFISSSKLQSLTTTEAATVLTTPIRRLLSSSLTTFTLFLNEAMESFTKEQDEALQLFTSLRHLSLSSSHRMQCLPAGLQKLTKLETLMIPGSPPAIHSLHKGSLPNSLQVLYISQGETRSLPKDSLPNSLLKLSISYCSSMRSLPEDGLPNSLQELEISHCPSIRALPKGDLPSSLQLLDVSRGNSEELRRQCRKLIGTIPIVKLD
ncbi:unnamed protein product [Urochloa humidicola]